MARRKGSANFAGSLEVLAGAPLDARLVVNSLTDLTAAASFPYKYKGMIVSVVEEEKAYMLIGDDTTDIENWKEQGEGGGGGTSNYNSLSNKPKINNVELSGNKTLHDLGIQAEMTVDSELSDESENPVQNKVIKNALDDKADIDDIPTATSDLNNDSDFVSDANYVHTDNNYTIEEKTKLGGLENYDDTEIRSALGDKVDKVSGKGLSENDYTDVDKAIVDGVTSALADKVDKISGKGLSTNDYTDADKTIVDGITNALAGKIDKSTTYSGDLNTLRYNSGLYFLASISPDTHGPDGEYNFGAYVIVFKMKENSADACQIFISLEWYSQTELQRTIYIRHYTSKGWTPWKGFAFDNEATTSVKGLMSAVDKTKLDGVETGADVNIIEEVKVNNTALVPDANKSVNIVIPAAAEYTIAETTTTTGYAKTYQLKKDDTFIGSKIDIPKDLVVESGEVKTVTTADEPYEGAVVGDKYIDLTLNDENEDHIYIPVEDLVDVYTAGDGINISNTNVVSNTGVRAIATGSTNGTISVNTNGTSIDVPIYGLGTAAYMAETAFAYSRNINQGNLNNYTTPGIYSSTSGAEIANKADTSSSFGLIVIHSSSSSAHYTQLYFGRQNNKVYIRFCVAGTWSEWTEFKYTDTTYEEATTTTAGLMSAADKAIVDDISTNLAGKADKVTSATNGDIATLDANGNLVDSGSKTSDFAIKQILTEGQDLNNITTPGLYNASSSTTINHKPEGNNGGFGLIVLYVGSNNTGRNVQMFFSYAGGPKYIRYNESGTWTDWSLMKFTDTTYENATTDTAGLMSAADKTKLDGLGNEFPLRTVALKLKNEARGAGYTKIFEWTGAPNGWSQLRLNGILGTYSSITKGILDIEVDFRSIPTEIAMKGNLSNPTNADIIATCTAIPDTSNYKCEIWLKFGSNYNEFIGQIESSGGTIYDTLSFVSEAPTGDLVLNMTDAKDVTVNSRVQHLGWDTYEGTTLADSVVAALNANANKLDRLKFQMIRATWSGKGYWNAIISPPRTVANNTWQIFVQYHKAAASTDTTNGDYIVEVLYDSAADPKVSLVNSYKLQKSIVSPTNNNLVAMDADGNIKDTGKSATNFMDYKTTRLNLPSGGGWLKLGGFLGAASTYNSMAPIFYINTRVESGILSSTQWFQSDVLTLSKPRLVRLTNGDRSSKLQNQVPKVEKYSCEVYVKVGQDGVVEISQIAGYKCDFTASIVTTLPEEVEGEVQYIDGLIDSVWLKQNQTLDTSVTVDGVEKTTVQAALSALTTSTNGKIPAVTSAVMGDIPILTAEGKLVDGGVALSAIDSYHTETITTSIGTTEYITIEFPTVRCVGTFLITNDNGELILLNRDSMSNDTQLIFFTNSTLIPSTFLLAQK